MADTVRYLLEEMLPELEELEAKGFFTKAELKQIVQKRTDFEYQLKRRAALKRDFLRYIDFECKLEDLRRLRKKAKGIKGKQGLGEIGIVRRVHFIFERATRKFKADLSLWMAWIEYCKRSKSTKQLSKVLTKALHRHSHVPALWIEAASWEFEATGNVAAARALMQRGLRHCPHDEGLWAEYVRLELLYVARLRARRAVLGLPNPDASEDFVLTLALKPKRRRDGTTIPAVLASSAVPEADPGQQGPGEPGAVDVAGVEGASPADAAVRSVLTGGVARVAMKGAVAALPASLTLRRRLLAVLAVFNFPGIERLRAWVFDGLATDFPANEESWDLRARQHWPGSPASDTSGLPLSADSLGTAEVDMEGHEACCGVYELAVTTVPSARMWSCYTVCFGQRVQPLLASADCGGDVELLASMGAGLLALHARAAGAGHVGDEALAEAHAAWALALGQPRVALRAARKACDASPSAAPLWRLRLGLELQLHASRQRSTPELLTTLGQALAAVAPGQAPGMWSQALSALPPGKEGHAALQDQLVQALAAGPRGPVAGGLGEVLGNLLKSVAVAQGMTAVRTLVARLARVPPPGCDFYLAAIALEESLLEGAPDPAKAPAVPLVGKARSTQEARVRLLYETAINAYGTECEALWLALARFERRAGRSGGDVFWRAHKALPDPEEFVTQYRTAFGQE